MEPRYLDSIKRFEGFTPRAQWDYAQHTNGYGTKAHYPGEVITRDEAGRRFHDEIAGAAALVDRFAPHLDTGTRAALTSLTFNAGPGWMRSGLGAAIEANDLKTAQSIFLQYAKAGGEILPGLVARRVEEAQWFGVEGRDGAAAPRATDTASTAPLAPGNEKAAAKVLAVVTGEPLSPPAGVVSADETPGTIQEVAALWEQVKIDQVRLLTLRKSEDESA